VGCERFDLSHDGQLIAYVKDEDGLSVIHVRRTANQVEILYGMSRLGCDQFAMASERARAWVVADEMRAGRAIAIPTT